MEATLQALTPPRQAPFPTWEQPPSLTIGLNGCILRASDNAASFFEYPSAKLVGLYISVLVPTLDEIEVPGHKNTELVRYLSRCGVTFMAYGSSNRNIPCHLSIVALHDSRDGIYRVIFTQPKNSVLATAIYPRETDQRQTV